MKLPRGIRNHNPGNIRHGGGNWQGLAAEQADPAFCTFTSPVYGLRALACVLLNYQRKHRLKTLYAILNRYAPAVENDTGSYIAHVARRMGIDQTTSVDVAKNLMPLMQAIVAHENGPDYANYYPAETYKEAMRLALGA